VLVAVSRRNNLFLCLHHESGDVLRKVRDREDALAKHARRPHAAGRQCATRMRRYNPAGEFVFGSNQSSA